MSDDKTSYYNSNNFITFVKNNLETIINNIKKRFRKNSIDEIVDKLTNDILELSKAKDVYIYKDDIYKLLKKYDLNPKDINKRFIKSLSYKLSENLDNTYNYHTAAKILSGLMNVSEEEEFEIILNKPFHYLGIDLYGKKLKIISRFNGEIGNHILEDSIGSEVTIIGNVGKDGCKSCLDVKIKVSGYIRENFGDNSNNLYVEADKIYVPSFEDLENSTIKVNELKSKDMDIYNFIVEFPLLTKNNKIYIKNIDEKLLEQYLPIKIEGIKLLYFPMSKKYVYDKNYDIKIYVKDKYKFEDVKIKFKSLEDVLNLYLNNKEEFFKIFRNDEVIRAIVTTYEYLSELIKNHKLEDNLVIKNMILTLRDMIRNNKIILNNLDEESNFNNPLLAGRFKKDNNTIILYTKNIKRDSISTIIHEIAHALNYAVNKEIFGNDDDNIKTYNIVMIEYIASLIETSLYPLRKKIASIFPNKKFELLVKKYFNLEELNEYFELSKKYKDFTQEMYNDSDENTKSNIIKIFQNTYEFGNIIGSMLYFISWKDKSFYNSYLNKIINAKSIEDLEKISYDIYNKFKEYYLEN